MHLLRERCRRRDRSTAPPRASRPSGWWRSEALETIGRRLAKIDRFTQLAAGGGGDGGRARCRAGGQRRRCRRARLGASQPGTGGRAPRPNRSSRPSEPGSLNRVPYPTSNRGVSERSHDPNPSPPVQSAAGTAGRPRLVARARRPRMPPRCASSWSRRQPGERGAATRCTRRPSAETRSREGEQRRPSST